TSSGFLCCHSNRSGKYTAAAEVAARDGNAGDEEGRWPARTLATMATVKAEVTIKAREFKRLGSMEISSRRLATPACQRDAASAGSIPCAPRNHLFLL